MKNPINNTVFDSRDLIEYKEELENDLLNFYAEYIEEHNTNVDEDEREPEPQDFDDVDLDLEGFRDRHEDDIEEYEGIRDLCEELSGYGDFEYGAGIIHEDYFTEYTKELCEDIGDIPANLPWYIENHIDWDGVAKEIMMDYTAVSYNGDTYYMRS